MFPSLSWTEPTEWEALIADAMSEQPRRADSKRPAQSDGAPVHPDDAAVTQRTSSQSMSAGAAAESLTERLQSFSEALISRTRADSVFIADESGLEIHSLEAEAGYIAVSGELARQLRNTVRFTDEPLPHYLTVHFPDGRTLHVVEANGRVQRFVIGIVSHSLLATDEAEFARHRLLEALNE